jgi:acetamidase/formamidase
MQKFAREHADIYSLDRTIEPGLRVEAGERFLVETQDTAAGRIVSADQLPFDRPGLDTIPPMVNPLAGPIYIEGIRKGDMLCVSIHELDVSHRQSMTFTSRRGPLKDSARWGEADRPKVHILRHEVGPSGTMVDGTVHFNERVHWLAEPFIGTIAVTPEREVPSTLLGQGAFGGNMDCRDIRAGSKIFLTAQVDGALLCLGDLHASQGDMEFTGVAAETEGQVELSVDNLGSKNLPFPRIETNESLIALHISRPLDHALTSATLLLIEWLVDDHGMDPGDAYLQISTNPRVRANVYQMLPLMALNYVAGVQFPKSCVR